MGDITYPTLIKVVSYFPNHNNIYITSTTGGHHAPNSYHYRKEAIDVGSKSQVYKDQLAAWLYPYSRFITELLHTKAGDTGGWYVKNGVRKPHGWYGRTLDLAHINHVHLASNDLDKALALLAAVRRDHPPKPYVYPSSKPAFPGTLRKGMSGNNVRTLHRRLNILGYKPEQPEAGAVFNGDTVNRVKALQKRHGLVQDGLVGPRTFNALWS